MSRVARVHGVGGVTPSLVTTLCGHLFWRGAANRYTWDWRLVTCRQCRRLERRRRSEGGG